MSDPLVTAPGARTPQPTTIRLPPHKGPTRATRMLERAFLGAVLSPIYWAAAAALRVPGTAFRAQCVRLALAALRRGTLSPTRSLFELLVVPLDSTRYFEIDFVWRALRGVAIRRYLDVSSPRVLPLALLLDRPDLSAEILNPDRGDLDTTAALARATRVIDRCRFHGALIDAAPLAPASFDLITSVSVVEHIPRDWEAVSRMWTLLRRGGRLLLTVPCAARAREERIDFDHYGVLARGEDGLYFHQWIYDRALLFERFYGVTGQPRRTALWGERDPGALRRRLDRKWSDPAYPFWREPLEMHREFRRFDRLEDLPGEGVFMMEFVKP